MAARQNWTKKDAPISGGPGGTALRSRELSGRGSSSAVRNPARIISTIEALAVLLGFETAQRWQWVGPEQADVEQVPIKRMELACYLERMSIKAVVDWAPRTANYEVDELANGSTHRFDPAKRIAFKESDVWWEALQKGREVGRECQTARTEGAGLPDTRAQKRRRPKDIRVKDPW